MADTYEFKLCKVCKEEKRTSEFYKAIGNFDRIANKCKKCHQQQRKERYITNRKSELEQCRMYREANREYLTSQTTKDKRKNSYLFKKYGITLEQYNIMIKNQNNTCCICKDVSRQDVRQDTIVALAVDHNHQTGAIRGLLCSKCNVGLGYLKDSISIISKGIVYLSKPKKSIPGCGKNNKQYGNKKSYAIFRKYGLAEDAYKQMIQHQKNKCPVCKVQFNNSIKGSKICVDHDHQTGTVRGLLCFNCNLGIGQFDDSIEYLISASRYLSKYTHRREVA